MAKKVQKGDVWTLELIVKRGLSEINRSFIFGRHKEQMMRLADFIIKNGKRLAKEAEETMPDPRQARASCGGCLANVICPEHGGRAVEARRTDFDFIDGPRRGFFTTRQKAGVKARGLEAGFCGDGTRRARFFVSSQKAAGKDSK